MIEERLYIVTYDIADESAGGGCSS